MNPTHLDSSSVLKLLRYSTQSINQCITINQKGVCNDHLEENVIPRIFKKGNKKNKKCTKQKKKCFA